MVTFPWVGIYDLSALTSLEPTRIRAVDLRVSFRIYDCFQVPGGSTLGSGIMDAPPIIRYTFVSKIWDFVFGCLLIGGVPLSTYWLLVLLSDLPCNFVFHHYGERAAFRLQMVLLAIAFFAGFPAFIFAIFWRTRHRVLPKSLLVLEIVVAIVWAFFFFACLGVIIGPNDDAS